MLRGACRGRGCLFKRIATLDRDKIISYYLNTVEAFNEFVHLPLENLGR